MSYDGDMRPNGSPAELERRRLRALSLLEEGLAPVEVAQRLGVDRRSVRRWKASVRDAGPQSLKAQPASGRPPKLPARLRPRLERLLLRGAQKAGFANDLWTCPRVVQAMEEHFGVRYHPDHVGRLLHGLGWSPQRPVRRARERDEDRIEHWVKFAWRRIKKKPGA
jgi:transposase